MVLLENDVFMHELSKMFLKTKNSGSVTITMKRYDGRDRHFKKDNIPQPQEYMCLIRASHNNKKISTVVNHKEVTKFQQAYSSLLKGNMDGLKKLKKTKIKSKAT